MKKCIVFFSLIVLTSYLKAQVPVSKEPRHHVVFENEKVRLLNVLILPGDTTQYHVHSTPSVFVCFTRTRTASQLMGKEPGSGTSTAGSVWFENFNPPNIKIHRVWNQDTAVYHVMDIELLAKDSGFRQRPLSLTHVQLTSDTPWARTYTIELPSSQTLTVKEHASAFILVAINNGMINMINGSKQSLTLQPGTFFWIKPDEQFTLLNQLKTVIQFALIEIR